MLHAENLTQLDEVLLILFDASLQVDVLLWHVWVLFIDDSHRLFAELEQFFPLHIHVVILILLTLMVRALYDSGGFFTWERFW